MEFHRVNVYSFLLKDLLSFLNIEVSFENINEATYSGLHNYVSKETIKLQQNFNAKQLEAIKLQQNFNAKQKHNAKPKTLKERREKEQKNRHNKSQRKNKSAIALPESTINNDIIAEILAKDELELANARFAQELRRSK
jgi:hypothetical protein